MIEIIGWIGIVLLVISYLFLNTKYTNFFIIINVLGSGFLFWHAVNILDYVFIFANGFIILMWLVKFFKGGIK